MTWALIEANRAILLGLALWCMWLHRSGPVALWRGSQSMAHHGLSVPFFCAWAALMGQIYFLAWARPPMLLFSLMLMTVGLGLSVWLSYRARATGLSKLDCLINQPHLSLPLIELAELDPPAAQVMADEIRRMIAQRKVGQ